VEWQTGAVRGREWNDHGEVARARTDFRRTDDEYGTDARLLAASTLVEVR
jgi:hypothetical protein